MLRQLMIAAMIFGGLSLSNENSAQDVFRQWGQFPGPNPSPDEILPGRGQDKFAIGQVIFSYSFDTVSKMSTGVTKLEAIEAVAPTVKRAQPDASVSALIEKLLQIPHRFDLEEVSLKDYGDAGFVWHITWQLFPRNGGSTGVPFRYTAIVIPSGDIVPPVRTLYDTYFLAGRAGCLCSTLSFDLLTPIGKTRSTLKSDEILNRGKRRLEEWSTVTADDGTEEKEIRKSISTRMHFHNQTLVEIPIAVTRESQVSQKLWAVNFVDSKRDKSENQTDVFTIWVTLDGQVATLKLINL